MFISKKHISRRMIIRGMGASMALPFLESMVPAMTPARTTEAANPKTRLACLEMVHGSAGSTKFGAERNMWSPAAAGHNFDLAPTSLLPLDPWKDYLTIVSNTDMHAAEAWELHEVGADHFRCSAVFLTQAHPKQTEGSDIWCGTSFDQIYAKRFGQDTPLPSLQLAIESVDQSGGCGYGYSCVYLDSISWTAPKQPLPMVRDPRLVFDELFGVGGTPEEQYKRRKTDKSILDWITHETARLKTEVSAGDRLRMDQYLENVREIERRIQAVEARNSSGEARQLAAAPAGVPDNWAEHVKLMMDLQVIAFTGDVTRVSAFKLSRDVTGRAFPESGVNGGFHGLSHHGENDQRITQYAALNKYHVSMVPYFLDKLKKVDEGDGTLLDHSLILYGSPMGDSNLHNHRRVPMFLAGHANGALKGHLHLITPDGTPSANLYLTLLHRLGIKDTENFGDSTGELEI